MRALLISRSLLASLSIHLRNVAETRPPTLFYTAARMLSNKHIDGDDTVKVFEPDNQPEPKYRKRTQDYKEKINLRDIHGNVIGLKTRYEAMQIANKNNWMLVEDDLTKKMPTFKLVDPRQVLKEEEVNEIKAEHEHEPSFEEQEGETETAPKAPKLHQNASQKYLLFSSKISEHDLDVKMNHMKKWLARGMEIKIRVNAAKQHSLDKLKFIDRQMEKTFNLPEFGIKINQKRLTPQELMLTIVPFDKELAKNIVTTDEKHVDNIAEMDPNQLLSGDLDLSYTAKK